jgi:hypothetical protein
MPARPSGLPWGRDFSKISRMPHFHAPILHLHALPPAAALIVGVVLLIFGRKLFWFFVGALGFVVGAEAAATLFPHQPGAELIAGIILGLLGILMAILLQKIAIGVAGFWAGGYFAVVLLRTMDLPHTNFSWVAFVVGGILGAILMFTVFDWALIILSSVSGAHLIVHSTNLVPTAGGLTFLVCALIGIFVQSRFLMMSRRAEAV